MFFMPSQALLYCFRTRFSDNHLLRSYRELLYHLCHPNGSQADEFFSQPVPSQPGNRRPWQLDILLAWCYLSLDRPWLAPTQLCVSLTPIPPRILSLRQCSSPGTFLVLSFSLRVFTYSLIFWQLWEPKNNHVFVWFLRFLDFSFTFPRSILITRNSNFVVEHRFPLQLRGCYIGPLKFVFFPFCSHHDFSEG